MMYYTPLLSVGFFSDVACKWTRPTAYAYRYFLHTHHYGRLKTKNYTQFVSYL